MSKRLVVLYVVAVLAGIFIIGNIIGLLYVYKQGQDLEYSDFYGLSTMLLTLSGIIVNIGILKHKN